ncbi:MAG: 50S ribosomal protein L5 [Candidatus Omnitrophica bacterium]|nr:50S ribosomal protein L5 [Candidatus Omnitrophota bacterium]
MNVEKKTNTKVTPRLLVKYRQEIVPAMIKKLNFKNALQVPRLKKIVINVGLGEAVQDAKLLDGVMREISQITGQHPSLTRAKKAIAGFKIRKGLPVGCRVTLRRARMYEFLDRLINIAIPRIRDFRGLPAGSFDENGNYSFGITEQVIFPEIDMDKITIAHGMDITIVTDSGSKNSSYELLSLFRMPFRKGVVSG